MRNQPNLRKVLVILLLMIILVFAYSKLDWWVTNKTLGWAHLIRYWAWQNSVWILFGLTVAIAYWAAGPPSRRTKIVMVLIFFSFGIVVVSNLLDWMYYWFNQYVLPPIDEKWTWMPQSWVFGLDWGTPEQARWTVSWLLMIPLMWVVAVKYILPKWGE